MQLVRQVEKRVADSEEIRTGREKQHCCHEGVPENKTPPSHLKRLSRVDSSCHWTSAGAHWSGVPHTVGIRLERPAAVCLLWQSGSGRIHSSLPGWAGPCWLWAGSSSSLAPASAARIWEQMRADQGQGGVSVVARGGCTERQMARCALTRAD